MEPEKQTFPALLKRLSSYRSNFFLWVAGMLVAMPILAFARSIETSSYLPLLLNAWPTPQAARLLIAEVVYDPPGPEPGAEWIELYNAGGSPVEVSVYKLGDEETLGEQEGMFAFPPGAVAEPGQVIVVAGQAAAFAGLYGLAPDYELRESDPGVPDMVKHTAWAGGNLELGNSGDEVLLLGPGDELVDALSWGSSTFAFDPPVPKVPGNHSLERFPADADTGTAADWRNQEHPSPGSVIEALPTPTSTLQETPAESTPTSDGTQTPSPTAVGVIDTPTGTLTPSATIVETSATPTGTPTPIPPSSLVMNEVHADPHSIHGDANYDGTVNIYADEFIEIVNGSRTNLDLSGWSLQDRVKVRHLFPPGSSLPAGCAVLVFGGGTPAGGFGGSLVQTASTGTLALNNDGDTLTLLDLSQTAMLTYTYGTEGGDNQSLTRSPDLTGPEPLVKHMTAAGSGGALFSPGTRVSGELFSGCPLVTQWIAWP